MPCFNPCSGGILLLTLWGVLMQVSPAMFQSLFWWNTSTDFLLIVSTDNTVGFNPCSGGILLLMRVDPFAFEGFAVSILVLVEYFY